MVKIEWQKVLQNGLFWGILGFIFGARIIWWPMLNGISVFSALFAYIIATLDFAFAAREWVGWLAFFGIIIVGISGLTGLRLRNHPAGPAFHLFTSFAIGWGISRGLIMILLDNMFFAGAVVTLPFMIGVILLAGAVGNITYKMTSQTFAEDRKNFFVKSISSGLAILLALLLILPNLTAVAGLLASPPERPEQGYGSLDSPYEVVEYSISPEYPTGITSWWDEWSFEQEWNVHIFVPVGVESESVGLAVYLHGYEGEKIEFYRGSMKSLASQGVIAIFPQYVSDVDLSTVEDDFELNYSFGGSNHPQHLPRYTMAQFGVDSALAHIANDSAILQTLGGAEIDTNHLWIGGHSMGAGTTFYVLGELLERGFGSESLVVNLEAPWVRANQPELAGNMSNLPDHSLIHVVEYETDLNVEKCLGRWQHASLLARGSAPSLPAENVLFLQIPSDYYGFPRLIASHYLPADLVRDSLADNSYYPRIEAQADYIAKSASGDTAGAQSAKTWFMTEGEMTNLGDWSDGTPVRPIEIVAAPLELSEENPNACPTF